MLSDPQERAWYDTHQHADPSEEGTTAGQPSSGGFKMTTSHITSLMMKFNPYMDFSDSPSGFFGGLREVFDQIAADEEMACRWEEGSDPVDYPSFGSKGDSYDDVVRSFYAVWTSFSTKKSFAWKDKYRYSEAPDRRIRRLMEKENKKMREDGIREYNDAVRSLVAFVKKRDPRYKMNVQSEAERQRMLRESAAAQAARSRAANQAKMQDHVIPEWAQQTSEDADDLEGQFFSSSESEVEHFECVVCNKIFKSQKQFEAHERSKKHVKAVKQLRKEMLIQDEELHLDGSEKPDDMDEQIEELENSASVHELSDTAAGEMIAEELSNGDKEMPAPQSTTSPSPPASPSPSVSSKDEEDPDYFDLHGPKTKSMSPVAGDRLDSESGDAIDSSTTNTTTAKLGKAKQKRAKKLAAQNTAASAEASHKCAFCETKFPSRTQLFSHLRDTGHAQPIPANRSKQRKGKQSKK